MPRHNDDIEIIFSSACRKGPTATEQRTHALPVIMLTYIHVHVGIRQRSTSWATSLLPLLDRCTSSKLSCYLVGNASISAGIYSLY